MEIFLTLFGIQVVWSYPSPNSLLLRGRHRRHLQVLLSVLEALAAQEDKPNSALKAFRLDVDESYVPIQR